MWMPALEEEVRRRLNGESSGHDPWHAFRVCTLGTQIALAVAADVEIVQTAALLHDVGHVLGRADHAESGARLATEILARIHFPSEKIPAVVGCIEHHHWQPGRIGDPRRPTLEYQAFADADRLDALGAVGIARAFAFGGAHHRPIWNPDASAEAPQLYGASSIHHFYDKLLHLAGDMYTEPGRRLAQQRVAIMQDFLRTFYAEWAGQDAETVRTAPLSLGAFAQTPIEVGDGRRHIAAAVLQPDPVN